MNTVKMPGFTAEASIYNTGKVYDMSGNLNRDGNGMRQNIILPSMLPRDVCITLSRCCRSGPRGNHCCAVYKRQCGRD